MFAEADRKFWQELALVSLGFALAALAALLAGARGPAGFHRFQAVQCRSCGAILRVPAVTQICVDVASPGGTKDDSRR